MFSSLSLPFTGWLRPSSSKRVIELEPVPVHSVGSTSSASGRRLKHLLKANHAKYSVIYNDLRFHNHTPHLLGTAYILGATPDHLDTCYEEESKQHEPWRASPGEISKDDWRDFLGKREYQRAFVDFFEDQLVDFGYDWRPLVEHYMYEGERPLIHSVVSGLAHPLIHLGYAHELSSQDVAIESLALTTCFYDDLHKYLDDPSYTRPSSYASDSPLKILQKVSRDKRLDGLFSQPDAENAALSLQKKEDVILDHWNAWKIDENPKAQFEASQRAAVALVVATHRSGQNYDFFLLHLLTSSHAVRILLPIVPAQFQVALVRQWFLFALLAYVAQLRPALDLDVIKEVDTTGKTWKHIDHTALTSAHATDAHFVKGLRAMHNAADTWGDDDEFFLKAALKLAAEFDGWGGFAG